MEIILVNHAPKHHMVQCIIVLLRCSTKLLLAPPQHSLTTLSKIKKYVVFMDIFTKNVPGRGLVLWVELISRIKCLDKSKFTSILWIIPLKYLSLRLKIQVRGYHSNLNYIYVYIDSFPMLLFANRNSIRNFLQTRPFV